MFLWLAYVFGLLDFKPLEETIDSLKDHPLVIDIGNFGLMVAIELAPRDGEAARYFSDNIKVGMIGINVPLPVPVAYHSFE